MIQKKKIAFCITHTQLGGAQKYVYNIMERLRDRYEVYCISSFEGALRADFYALEGIRRIEIRPLKRGISPMSDIVVFFRLVRLFRDHRFRLVHFNSPKISLLGRMALFCARVPTIAFYTFHLLEFSFPCRTMKERLCRSIEKLLNAATDYSIVNSRYEQRVLLRHGFAAPKVRLIYPGIEHMRFAAVKKRRAERGPALQAPRVLHITSFKAQKDPFFFLRFAQHAVALLPSLRIDIIGDGPLKGKAERFIARHGLSRHIRVHGWRRDVESFLEDAACLVVTSRRESLSYAVLEALASGVPVMNTCTGPLEEVVIGGMNGCFFEKRAYPMAVSISNMLQNEKSVYTMNEIPRSPAVSHEEPGETRFSHEFFDCARMVREIERLYQESFKER